MTDYIKAKIIADSINWSGERLTTFELEYPRFIHAEIMTHRVFSRNAQSSRAVPVSKTIEVNKRYVKPLVWGKNKAGMSSTEGLTGVKKLLANVVWNTAAKASFGFSAILSKLGLHKQWSNRLTEWCSLIKVVITSTEWENFLWLRTDADAAQPEIVALARKIENEFKNSTPVLLKKGEWHLPYIKLVDGKYYTQDMSFQLSLHDAKMVSVSACAQASYRKLDLTPETAIRVNGRLLNDGKPHMSPFEHQGTPIDEEGDSFEWFSAKELYGCTHIDKDLNPWSGNLKGWCQLRQIINTQGE